MKKQLKTITLLILSGILLMGCDSASTSPAIEPDSSSSITELSSGIVSNISSVVIPNPSMPTNQSSSSIVNIVPSSSGTLIQVSSSATNIIPSSSSVARVSYQLLADTNFSNTSLWSVKDYYTISSMFGKGLAVSASTYAYAPNALSVTASGSATPSFIEHITLPAGYFYEVTYTVRLDQVADGITNADLFTEIGLVNSNTDMPISNSYGHPQPTIGSSDTYTLANPIGMCYTNKTNVSAYVYVAIGVMPSTVTNAVLNTPFKYTISKVSVIAHPCPF
jgi:hypothetical protein